MMKNFLLGLFILFLSVNSVLAQYKRKLKEPDFFIPYNDRMHKEEKLPEIKVFVKTIDKTDNNKVKEKKIADKNKKVFSKIPDYKKIYDDYLESINLFITTKSFDKNDGCDEDLKVMYSGDIFEVTENNNSNIETQEQYDFYMLAKSILEN